MSELKEYITQEQENGAIFISQDVIATIAAVAASEVEGVCALAGSQGGEFSVDLLSGVPAGGGLEIMVDEGGLEVLRGAVRGHIGEVNGLGRPEGTDAPGLPFQISLGGGALAGGEGHAASFRAARRYVGVSAGDKGAAIGGGSRAARGQTRRSGILLSGQKSRFRGFDG